MTEWYYAEGNRHRQGPLPAENLRELLRSGRIGLDTLVWRDGLAQWQPLGDFTAELGLSDAAPAITDADPDVPPPLPPIPPATATMAAAPAAAPRTGLSGCAIAAIAASVAGVLGLAVVGILAAIAVPAYQDYVARSKVTEVLATAAPVKGLIIEFHTSEGRCPVNDDPGFGTPESYADGAVGSLRIGRFDNGHCGMEAILATPGQSKLDGKALWLDLDADDESWECSSEIDDRLLPLECRG